MSGTKGDSKSAMRRLQSHVRICTTNPDVHKTLDHHDPEKRHGDPKTYVDKNCIDYGTIHMNDKHPK